MDQIKRIKIVVRHYPEDGNFNVSDIELSQLIGGLTEEPLRLARGASDGGSIRIEIERTHEWEYALGIVIAGGAVFAKSVLETLGKRVGNWIADWAEKRFIDEPVEVQGEQDELVKIDPSNPATTRADFVKLIDNAAEHGATVVILFPW